MSEHSESALHGRRVLITRPALQAQSLAAAVTQNGGNPVELPMIDIDIYTEEQIEKDKILNLDYYDIIISVSANAARSGFNHIDQYWPQLPAHIIWLAVGAATAEILSAYGIDVKAPEHANSEGLLSMPVLQNINEQRALIMKGQGGRDLLAKTLESRGAKVDILDLYQRHKPSYTEAELEVRLREKPPEIVLATSVNILDNLEAIVTPCLPSLKDLPLIVASPRIAKHAEVLGFKNVITAFDASDEAMLESLKRLS